MSADFELSLDELRAVTEYAVACARPVLAVFERERPGDARPREAVEVAAGFAAGGPRTRAIRTGAFAAHRAAREARDARVGELARELDARSRL